MFKVKIYSANRLKSPQKYCKGTKLYFFVGKSKHVLLNFRWFLVGSALCKPLLLTLKIGKKKQSKVKKKLENVFLRIINVKIFWKKGEEEIFPSQLGCKAHQF